MTQLQNVHLVPRSNNRKTGPLPVTYRPVTTCPTDCPFLPAGETGGCYGTGRIFASAQRHATSLDLEWATWMIRLGRDPAARYLRDRVVGDAVTPEGQLDLAYLEGIARVATANGLIPFGYTHAWRRFTADDVLRLGELGYVMNASTETVRGSEVAAERGLAVALVDDEIEEGALVAGRRIVTCPAETNPAVSCADCGLCAKADRSIIVRFTTHGTARARAQQAVALARASETEGAAA